MQFDLFRIMASSISTALGAKNQCYKTKHWHRSLCTTFSSWIMDTAARARITLWSLLLFLGLSFAQNAAEGEAGTLNVGAILNMRSLLGKMSRTSILMAMEDFYAVHRDYATKLVLHIRDSNGGGNIQAASAGTFHYEILH